MVQRFYKPHAGFDSPAGFLLFLGDKLKLLILILLLTSCTQKKHYFVVDQKGKKTQVVSCFEEIDRLVVYVEAKEPISYRHLIYDKIERRYFYLTDYRCEVWDGEQSR